MNSGKKKDASYWRRRAEELRTLAESMHVPGGQTTLLMLAHDCMGLAAEAEERERRQAAKDDPAPDQD